MIEDTRIPKLTDVLVFIQLFRFGSEIVRNVLTIAFPSHIGDFRVFDGVSERSHSFVIGTIWLHEITQMESVSLAFPGVLYSKVIPLCEALG